MSSSSSQWQQTLPSHSIALSLDNLCDAFTVSLETLSHSLVTHYFGILYEFEILSERHSESASLIFAKHVDTNERAVIKILRKYQDNRYSLKTIGKRQQCQLEALRCNRLFSPGIYIGLVRISKRSATSIFVREIIEDPTEEELDPKSEYGLLMYELPESRRLDFLLERESEFARWQHIQLLAQYVAYMHTKLTSPANLSRDAQRWGTFEQIQSKLEHNLALLDFVVLASENGGYNPSYRGKAILKQLLPRSWYQRYYRQRLKCGHSDLSTSDRLKEIFNRLRNNIHQVFRPDPYQQYFEQRMREERIRRCHGDLKAPHIWIAPYQWPNSEPWKYVRVLDAIDFNPMYSNIDILSDLAMLVIDVQARIKSSELAKLLVKDYLYHTRQKDEVSIAVLTYYLVEKAVMWAAVSIVYDDLPELGIAFLEVAAKYMNDLNWNDLMPQADTLLTISSDVPLLSFHSKRNQSG